MSIWRIVPGYEDYLVSVRGEVWSLKQEKPFELKQANDGKGYKVVNLNGKLTFVHRIVAAAFLGLDLKDSKKCVMHKDDNPQNNNLYNLMVGTQQDNLRDMYNKGRNYAPDAKITLDIAAAIRNRRSNGESGASLAREYGISQSLVCSIYKGTRWTK